jgi:hypothetical protein
MEHTFAYASSSAIYILLTSLSLSRSLLAYTVTVIVNITTQDHEP